MDGTDDDHPAEGPIGSDRGLRLDPPWRPLEYGGVGATPPPWARSAAWKDGRYREWREGGEQGARCRSGVLEFLVDPREWRALHRDGGRHPTPRSAAPAARPVAVEQPTAAQVFEDSDWTLRVFFAATVAAAEAALRDNLWRSGPPRTYRTGRVVALRDGGG
jgi:hypothetical protein